jgi:hypothetical protein
MVRVDPRYFSKEVLTVNHKKRTCERCQCKMEVGNDRYSIVFDTRKWPESYFFCSKKCLVDTVNEQLEQMLKFLD